MQLGNLKFLAKDLRSPSNDAFSDSLIRFFGFGSSGARKSSSSPLPARGAATIFTGFSGSALARSASVLRSWATLLPMSARWRCRVSRWAFQCSRKPMQWQSSPSSLRTILTLLRRELKASCCCSWLRKTRCRLSWYSRTSSARNWRAWSFSAASSRLLPSSSFSLRIFSPMNSIFSSRSALFSVKISRSCWQRTRVWWRLRVMILSQKEAGGSGGGRISLRASSGGSSFDLQRSCERILLSSLPAFSYSSSDSSSTKVLFCSSVLSSASFAYFRRSTFSSSPALRSPNFELLLIIIIMNAQQDVPCAIDRLAISMSRSDLGREVELGQLLQAFLRVLFDKVHRLRFAKFRQFHQSLNQLRVDMRFHRPFNLFLFLLVLDLGLGNTLLQPVKLPLEHLGFVLDLNEGVGGVVLVPLLLADLADIVVADRTLVPDSPNILHVALAALNPVVDYLTTRPRPPFSLLFLFGLQLLPNPFAYPCPEFLELHDHIIFDLLNSLDQLIVVLVGSADIQRIALEVELGVIRLFQVESARILSGVFAEINEICLRDDADVLSLLVRKVELIILVRGQLETLLHFLQKLIVSIFFQSDHFTHVFEPDLHTILHNSLLTQKLILFLYRIKLRLSGTARQINPLLYESIMQLAAFNQTHYISYYIQRNKLDQQHYIGQQQQPIQARTNFFFINKVYLIAQAYEKRPPSIANGIHFAYSFFIYKRLKSLSCWSIIFTEKLLYFKLFRLES